MTIAQAAEQYIQHKRSLGMKFENPAVIVRSFARAAGNAQSDDLDAGQVRAFLFGRGTSPQTAIQKWSTLRGLYRFALARGIATTSPLPVRMPQGLWASSAEVNSCRLPNRPPIVMTASLDWARYRSRPT